MIGAIVGALLVGGTLGLLGSGGSILTVPLLVYLVGHEEKSAIVESLAIVGIISLFSGLRRSLAKDVDWHAVLAFLPTSMVGAVGGTWLAQWLTGRTQLVLLALLMLAASWSMLRAKTPKSQKDAHANKWLVLVAGLFVGIATGVVGIGGGFLIVPTLVAAARVDMQKAIGSSLLIISMNCVVGLAGYTIGEHADVTINWGVIALFGALGIAGSLVGQALSKRIDRARLKKIFGVFVLLMALGIIASRL